MECSGFHEIEANIDFKIKLEETLEIAYYNLLSYDTRLYDTSSIQCNSCQPNFLVLIYVHTLSMMLVIQHFLGMGCCIKQVINVRK